MDEAYRFYMESLEILKKIDDFVWVLGCEQGKLACFTTDFIPEGIEDKHEIIEQCRIECLSLGKKIRIPHL